MRKSTDTGMWKSPKQGEKVETDYGQQIEAGHERRWGRAGEEKREDQESAWLDVHSSQELEAGGGRETTAGLERFAVWS